MQPPVALEAIDDTAQTRIVLWQSGKLCSVPATGLGTIGALARLTPTDGAIIVGDGTTWATVTTLEPGMFRAGQVLQEVVATRSTNDTTTTGFPSWANTGLSASITPLLSDSVIEALAFVPNASASLISSSSGSRRGFFRINNSTNSVAGPLFSMGRSLVASSSSSAATLSAVVAHMRYTVNSLATRTFILQFASGVATDIQVATNADGAPATLILREIKQ